METIEGDHRQRLPDVAAHAGDALRLQLGTVRAGERRLLRAAARCHEDVLRGGQRPLWRAGGPSMVARVARIAYHLPGKVRRDVGAGRAKGFPRTVPLLLHRCLTSKAVAWNNVFHLDRRRQSPPRPAGGTAQWPNSRERPGAGAPSPTLRPLLRTTPFRAGENLLG